ncbi:deoxyhypusine synthase [Candidatus Woesearchaeota archaeon]|nr:deoxyhypusine synthase [Candidatus Woesearchaeota archaeon]
MVKTASHVKNDSGTKTTKDNALQEPILDFHYHPQMSVADFTQALGSIGYQASHVKKAIAIITRMKQNKAKIFLTFTSNMVSSGLRGFFAQLIEQKMVDVIVTTVGSIEEDLMKAHGASFYLGSFDADDALLGKKGINRIGNIFVPNESYESFEDIIQPLLEKIYSTGKRTLTPSELIHELGCCINDPHSICYQASQKNIPIYCPAITDGSMGFQLYLFRQKHPDFTLDVVKDFSNIMFAVTPQDIKGVIVLGGGVAKHHAILATLLNEGMHYAVYITTAHPYSGSLSGATTNEAKSWGKIRSDGDAVTVTGEASILFPLIMVSVLDLLKK